MSTRHGNPTASAIQVVLRILTILATAAATYVMVTSKQSTVVYGIPLQAQYNYASAFKFFVYANGIACGLSVLSLIVALALCVRGSRASDSFFLPTIDLLVMSLVMAGFAAATAVGYIGKYGESHIGWMSICDNVAIFCRRVTTSVIASFIAFFLLKVIAIMTVFRL
ncbi:hypothetical protein MLD38_015975 [Melastoma candidum]|uniref:Uncharacterized protein n=1 Tax=Melastoma candidum TaxID=119954 RepID=A0ACB9RHZ8_9MYRT|nr:hypothetical protein MLD38_015975 [Melastoma candidum]